MENDQQPQASGAPETEPADKPDRNLARWLGGLASIATCVGAVAAIVFGINQWRRWEVAGPTLPPEQAATPSISTIDARYESYLVKLFVPTQHRGVSVLVDGRPAEVIKALPSLIEIRVQRKDSPTEFTLQGGHLKEAIRFTLFIEHNNFEYSPFQ